MSLNRKFFPPEICSVADRVTTPKTSIILYFTNQMQSEALPHTEENNSHVLCFLPLLKPRKGIPYRLLLGKLSQDFWPLSSPSSSLWAAQRAEAFYVLI